jgi:hypothetical protein
MSPTPSSVTPGVHGSRLRVSEFVVGGGAVDPEPGGNRALSMAWTNLGVGCRRPGDEVSIYEDQLFGIALSAS